MVAKGTMARRADGNSSRHPAASSLRMSSAALLSFTKASELADRITSIGLIIEPP
jgi:hypothetical protein